MQINGGNIPGGALARLVEETLPAVRQMEAEGTPCGEFMWDLALALLWFREEKADIAVIEAGIGGAGDATIALPRPLLSAIMGIGWNTPPSSGRQLPISPGTRPRSSKGTPPYFTPNSRRKRPPR